jgi:hypothetical protein
MTGVVSRPRIGLESGEKMPNFTRREIAVLIPKLRPEFYDLLRNGNVEGFKRLLNSYSPAEDDEEKQALIDEFLELFGEDFISRHQSRRTKR